MWRIKHASGVAWGDTRIEGERERGIDEEREQERERIGEEEREKTKEKERRLWI